MHSIESGAEIERAWLVATTLGDRPRAEVEDSLRELRALADTARAEVAGETLCRLREINPATYIGRGKAEQIAAAAQAADLRLLYHISGCMLCFLFIFVRKQQPYAVVGAAAAGRGK